MVDFETTLPMFRKYSGIDTIELREKLMMVATVEEEDSWNSMSAICSRRLAKLEQKLKN